MELRPRLEEWDRLHRAISTFCTDHVLPETFRYELLLVAEEWFANIVRHGYKGNGSSTDSIQVDLWMESGNEAVLQFIDAAPPFDPLKQHDPDIGLPAEQRQPGGLGIYFMKRKLDHMEYHRENGTNKLIMRKKMQSEGD